MDFTKERAKLHCHTDNSLRDSAEKIPNLVKRAKELGVPALALTNHGIMVGNIEFIKECEANGIKPIAGVEGYYSDDLDVVQDTHICLYAEDYESYSYIGMAISDAGNRLHNGKPVFNTEMLYKYFGTSSPVHGKVMMTSACVGGVFAKNMSANDNIKKDTSSLDKKIEKIESSFDSKRFDELSEKMREFDEELETLKERKKVIQPIIKKTYATEKKKIQKLEMLGKTEGEDYQNIVEKYNKLIKEQSEIKKEYVLNEDRIKVLNEERKAIKKEFDKLVKKKGKMDNHTNQKSELMMMQLSCDDMYALMKKKAELMIDIFGKDNVFCEIQYHNLEIEAYAFAYVVKLAKEYDLKLCAANDAHFAYNNKDSVRARQLMLSLRFDKYQKEEVDHKEYYLKSDKEMYDILSKIFDDDTIERAFDGVEEIANRCNIQLPKEKHYPKYHGNANEDLRKMAYNGISLRYPNNWDKEKEERLEYELSVIKDIDVSDYFCIVSDFIREAKRLCKQHETGIGYGVGPGRGSAAGSIIAYLTEITNIDPFQYDLLFERFLNSERVTMPDIDIDFSEEVREKAIRYVENKYGKEAVCQIITEGTMAARASIRNAAKFLGMEKGEPMMFSAIADSLAKRVPKEPNITLEKCEEMSLFTDLKGDEIEILHLAKLVEGTISGYSSHAAGIIIGDGGNVSRHIPLKYIPATKEKADAWVCQCDMVQAEEIGLLKMDFLGLKTLDVITKTLRLVKQNRGIVIDIDNIPFEQEVFANIYSKGDTKVVFQVESAGMKNFMKELKPENIEDIIAGIALYRPGPMDFIPKYINNKNNAKKIEYDCPQLEPILKPTYACIIYQEQVMQIVRDLAGYSLGRSDLVRRAMSKKKTSVMEKERKNFVYGNEDEGVKGCIANGISEEVANKIYDDMVDFAKYAFNKSHAAAYAVVSYQTAYLKYHYPIEYYAATMSVVDKKKIPAIMHEVKKKGFKIVPPDINESSKDFTVDEDKIVFGLNGIDGMGKKADSIINNRGFKYNSFKDFIMRGHEDTKSTTSLIHAGAFDTFTKNRKALENSMDKLIEISKEIKKRRIKVDQLEELYLSDKSNTDYKKKYISACNNLQMYEQLFKEYTIDIDIYEDELEKLNKEYIALGGLYLSGHPLDSYVKPLNSSYIDNIINEGYEGFAHLYGLVKNLDIKRRKSDGKEMAFFELEDTTGTINVACFTNEYIKLSDMIKENIVLKVSGKIVVNYHENIDENGTSADVEPEYQLILRNCEILNPIFPTVILNVPNMIYYIENLMDRIGIYHTETTDGNNLLIHDRMTGEFREYKYPVRKDIVELASVIENISFMDM